MFGGTAKRIVNIVTRRDHKPMEGIQIMEVKNATYQQFKKFVSQIFLVTMTLSLCLGFNQAKAQTNEVNLWASGDWIDSVWPIVEPALKSQYPGINVSLSPNDTLDMGTIRPALISGRGPDLLQVDAGPGRMGILAAAGLLTPMEPYYEEFGWDVLPWTKERVSHPGPDSEVQVYGVPDQVEFIAVFYKKKVFDDLGLSEPQSYDQFLALLRTLKDNGYLPLIGGFRDTYPRGWYISTFFQASAGKSEIDNILHGDGVWTNKDFVAGAREAQHMANEKFLIPESQSLDAGASYQLWSSNPKVVMTIDGTWDLPDLIVSDEEFDFFALPAINPTLSPGLIGGIGANFSIPANAKDPDAAARVLDVIYNEDVQREIIEQVGRISPFTYDKEQWNLPDLTREVVNILFDPNVSVGYNLSQVTPAGFVDEYYSAIQGLTIGKLTPEEFTTQLQTAWQENKPQ